MRAGRCRAGGGAAAWTSLLLPALLLAGGPSGCSPKESREARVRAFVTRAERAAEARDAAALKELVSEGYRDASGRNRRGLMAILAVHFMRNESVHLLTRVGGIRFPGEGGAEATVFAAMAGTPIAGAEDLRRVRADLYRFDVRLAETRAGAWLLESAEWRPATVADFLD